MQSAKVGQVAQMYPAWPARGASISQLRPAASSRSMSVGTHCTGEGRYGPEPSGAGMQDGSRIGEPPPGGTQNASLPLSQPQPGPAAPFGLSPVNPSKRPATRLRCEPQLGTAPSSNVR